MDSHKIPWFQTTNQLYNAIYGQNPPRIGWVWDARIGKRYAMFIGGKYLDLLEEPQRIGFPQVVVFPLEKRKIPRQIKEYDYYHGGPVDSCCTTSLFLDVG